MEGCLWPNEAPQEDKGQTLPCMHLKQAMVEPLTEVMDGAASPRLGGKKLTVLAWGGVGVGGCQSVYPVQMTCFRSMKSGKRIWTELIFV